MSLEKTGILLLVDVVDYTAQSVRWGTSTTQNFTRHFEKTMRRLAKSYNAYFIRIIGDAVLLFFESKTGLLDQFLDFTTQLHTESCRGTLDKFNFKCKLRMISHFGIFHFEGTDKRLKDFIGPQGIQIFRIEKLAGGQGIFIADSMLPPLESILNEKSIEVEEKFDGHIDGFRHKIRIYQLFIPLPKDQIVSSIPDIKEPDLLDLKMEELGSNCRKIPVFGTLYPPMRMEDSFINLDISPLSEIPDYRQHTPAGGYPLSGPHPGIDSIAARETKDINSNHDEKESKDVFSSLTVEDIYRKFRRGIILGFPGSGKTTTLRYFASKEYQNKKNIKKADNKRIIIFVSCHQLMPYTEWIEKYRHLYPGTIFISTEFEEPYLYYFLHEFLFLQDSPGSSEEVQKAGRRVWAAYCAGRLTLLVDALDEAHSNDIKEDVLNALKKLFQDCRAGKKTKNRLYLTARFSEREHVLAKKWEGIQEPLFQVRSLDTEQLRRLAEYFYKGNKSLYNYFSEAAWKDEIAVKVGGTPLTALLVLIYFECFQALGNRFEMYNIIMSFLLARAWKYIKDGTFTWDIKTFFKNVKNGNIFGEASYKDVGGIYDALSLLAYACEKEQIGDVNETELMEIFKKFADDMVSSVNGKADLVEEEAKRWLNRLKEDHVLLPVGGVNYVFIHQTVMEYLAARYVTKKLKNHLFHQDKFHSDTVESVINSMGEPFFHSEIIPIAVGSDIETGDKILNLLCHRVSMKNEERMREVLFLTAIKSLAEWESYFDHRKQKIRFTFLHSEFERDASANTDAVEWIYTSIKETLENKDRQALRTFRDKYRRAIPRLPRSILIKKFLTADIFFSGDSELIALRKELLAMFIAVQEVDKWCKQYEQGIGALVEGNLFNYNPSNYHPDDKNFNYYRSYTGETLHGLLGSPNFKHSHFVTCVAMSPDGKTILSGSEDRTIKWWDLETGKELKTFKGHRYNVKCIAFSPDGQTMVWGSDDKTVRWWNLVTGTVVKILKGHTDHVNCIAFSRDGQTIISGSHDNIIKWWNLDTGEVIHTFLGHEGPVNCIQFSPDGQTFISGSADKTARWWNLENGNEIKVLKGHTDQITGVLFTADGKTIISASWDKTIKLWNLETGKAIRMINENARSITGIALSPDGKTLISASWDKTINGWDVESGKEIRLFIGHLDHVNMLAFSPDGKTLLSGAKDNTIRCWYLDSGKEIRTFRGHGSFVNSICFSPDGQTLISGSRDNTIKWWDLQTGKEKQTFIGHHDHVNSVCCSPDGKTMISGSFDNTIKWWDLETTMLIKTFKGHHYGISGVCFHPWTKTMVSASFDNTLKLWCLESPEAMKTFQGHEGFVWSAVINPDGKTMVSASDDRTIKWWDIESGQVLKTFHGHEGHVYSIQLSPDGKTLISGSSDQSLKLWNLESGKAIRTFRGHEGIVWSAVFSPDGKYLISCSWDNTIKIWHKETGNCIETIHLLWRPREIKANPVKAGLFACANGNGTIALFDFSQIMNRKED